MRAFILAALAVTTTVAATAPALAREGCGPGFHRAYRGRCVPNRAGMYYRGQGYWDGKRYWQHRERWHNGWRYR